MKTIYKHLKLKVIKRKSKKYIRIRISKKKKKSSIIESQIKESKMFYC